MSIEQWQQLKPIDILLVEDNPGHVRLTVEAFKEGKVANKLWVVEDGVLAMDFLNQRPPYEKVPTPDIILLDLNLPRKDGREVLAEIKSDERLRVIPLVIMTTSQAEEDILQAYKLHANCYISKPIDFDKFMEVVRSIENFWLSVVKLPSKL